MCIAPGRTCNNCLFTFALFAVPWLAFPPAESPLLFIVSYCLVGHAPKLLTLCQDRARHRRRHRERCPAFHPALACPMCLQCHAPIPANVLQLGAKQQNHLMPATSRHFTFFFLFSFFFFVGQVNSECKRQKNTQKTKTNPTDVATFKAQVGKAHRERNILQYKRERKYTKIICKVYRFLVL